MYKFKQLKTLLLLVCSMLILYGCSGSGSSSPSSLPVIEMTSLNLTTGGSGFLTATLPSAPSSAVTVNFSFVDSQNILSSDAAQSCTIAAGATSCAIGVTAGNTGGTANAIASASGYQEATAIIIVASSPVIEMTSLNLTTGGRGFLTVTLPSKPSSAVTINFSFEDPNSVLSSDATQSCTVAAGSTSCAIGVTAGSATGTAIATATASGYQEATDIITVAALPVIEMTDLNVTTGGSGFLTVTLPSAPSSAVTVNFAFEDPNSVLSSDATQSCTVAAGSTSCAIGVAGNKAGTAFVSAYATGYQEATALITVAALPVIKVANLNLTTGGKGFLTATLPSAPSSAVTVTFTFIDPFSVLNNNDVMTCNVLAGNTTCSVSVTASSNDGDAGVGAVASGYQGATATIRVAALPVIEMTNLNLTTGGTGFLTATLPSAPSSAVTVTFTFIDPFSVLNNNDVMTCDVLAGNTTCSVSVTASSNDGDAGVGAVASGYQGATATIRVALQPVIKMTNLNLTTGGSGTLTAILPSAPSSAVTINFDFYDPDSVLDSDDNQSCIIAAGATSCAISVTAGIDPGRVISSAMANGYQTAVANIDAVSSPVIQITNYLSLATGGSGTLTATLSSAPSSTVTVTFIYFDPYNVLNDIGIETCNVLAGTTACNVSVTASSETGIAGASASASGYEGNEGIIAVHS